MDTEPKERALKAFKYGALVKLTKEALGTGLDPNFYVSEDLLHGGLIIKLRQLVWGENLKTEMIRFPKNWWEAVKERFLPRFLLRRFPVRYVEYEATWDRLYPALDIPISGYASVRRVKLGKVEETPGT